MRRSLLRPAEVCGPHNIDLSPQPERSYATFKNNRCRIATNVSLLVTMRRDQAHFHRKLFLKVQSQILPVIDLSLAVSSNTKNDDG